MASMDWHWHRRLSRQFRLVLAIGLILLLSVGGIPYFIPLPTLQQALSHAVSKSTHRSLQINDGTYFVLLPSPAIWLKKVVLSEPNSQQVFLRADRVRLELDIWPLFSGKRQAHIEGVTFKNAQFDLIRKENTQFNFDNLFATASDSPLLRVALKSINFQGSHLNIIDQGSRSTLRIVDLDLGLNDLQDPKHGNMQLTGKLALNAQKTWQGNIEGTAALRLDRDKHQLHVADLAIKVMQSYQYTATEGWTTNTLNINGNLHYGWQPLSLSGGDLILKSRAERSGQLWQTQIAIPEFHVANGVLAIDHAFIDNSMNKGTTSLISKAEIRNLSGTQHNLAFHTNDARINMQLKQPSQTLQLYFEGPLNVLGRQSITLPAFHVTGYYRNQSLPRGTLTFSQQGQASLNFRKEKLSLKSQGLLDKSPMLVQFGIQNFFLPTYQFTVDIEQLDLTPYLPVAIEGAKTLTSPTQVNDFSWLNALKAKGGIRIGTLKLQRAQMDNVQLGLNADSGVLTVAPLSASIYNGNLVGELAINNRGKSPQLRLRQRFSNVKIYPLFRNLFQLTRFDGRGYLNLDLAAAGHSSEEWQRTMGGTVDLSLARGTFKGLDILSQLRNTGERLYTLSTEPMPSIIQSKISETTTHFSDLRATFFVQKGIVYNKDLRINTGVFNLTGEGTYDIAEQALDYTVNANLNPHQRKTSGLDRLSGYSVPIHLTGSLQSPNYQIDYTPLREQIAPQHRANNASATTAKKK